MGNKVNVWLVSFIACLTKVIFAIDGFRLLTANLYHEILKRVDLIDWCISNLIDGGVWSVVLTLLIL